MYTRDQSVALIKEFVVSLDKVMTAWEGGSTATGYLDEFSDLDLYLVTKPEDKEDVLTQIVSFLQDTFEEENMFRIPEPAWHGFSQVFFNPKKTPELFYIDFVVIGEDIEDKLTESNRHGNPQIWKEEYKIDTTPRSDEKINQIADSIKQRISVTSFLTIIEMKKALNRENFSEAFPAYMGFISRVLVPLLNIKHRPEKADFGMRYMYRDYPEQDHSLIENALKVSTMEEMRKSAENLLKKYNELK